MRSCASFSSARMSGTRWRSLVGLTTLPLIANISLPFSSERRSIGLSISLSGVPCCASDRPISDPIPPAPNDMIAPAPATIATPAAIAAIVQRFAGLRRGRKGGRCAKAPYSSLSAGGGTQRAGCAGGAGGGGAACASARATRSSTGGPWNQLCLQLAQRTVRPSGPIALSGTRYRVRHSGHSRIIAALRGSGPRTRGSRAFVNTCARRHGQYRAVRECGAALRHRPGDAERSQLHPVVRLLLLPHRCERRRQDDFAKTALSRPV